MSLESAQNLNKRFGAAGFYTKKTCRTNWPAMFSDIEKQLQIESIRHAKRKQIAAAGIGKISVAFKTYTGIEG